MLTSQPLPCLLPSQSAKPTLQAPSQVPVVHVGVAMFWFEQRTPQPPQLAIDQTLVSQPSFCLLALQSPQPASHTPVHWLFAHVGALMWLLEQTTPQPPQSAVLAEVLVSQPL